MIINKELPTGLIANTAAVMGISLGRLLPEIVGMDIRDADSSLHRGITALAIPVLAATREQIQCIRNKEFEGLLSTVQVIDFSEVAQKMS